MTVRYSLNAVIKEHIACTLEWSTLFIHVNEEEICDLEWCKFDIFMQMLIYRKTDGHYGDSDTIMT